MEELFHYTPQEHYDKYEKLRQELGMKFDPKKEYFGYNREQLIELFKENPFLNQISQMKIDMHFSSVRVINKKARLLSLHEGTSLIKHCLWYDVIGCKHKVKVL